jgi:hypothetical protein
MPQFTLDMVLLLNFFTETIRILFREILRTNIGIDTQFRQDFLAERKSDPIQVWE